MLLQVIREEDLYQVKLKSRGWTYMACWLMLVSFGFTPFAVERSERVLGRGMT